MPRAFLPRSSCPILCAFSGVPRDPSSLPPSVCVLPPCWLLLAPATVRCQRTTCTSLTRVLSYTKKQTDRKTFDNFSQGNSKRNIYSIGRIFFDRLILVLRSFLLNLNVSKQSSYRFEYRSHGGRMRERERERNDTSMVEESPLTTFAE